MTNPLVKPVTCKGCGGKGYVILASGSIGHHFICDGTGQVESDRKTIAATKARIARRGKIISALQDLGNAHKKSYRIAHAIDGFDMLGRREPERAAKAEASILAGRPDVFLALADYYVEHREEERAEQEAAKVARREQLEREAVEAAAREADAAKAEAEEGIPED
jgi:hypothetical protein